MFVCIHQKFWVQELQGDEEGNGSDGIVLVGVKDNRQNIGEGLRGSCGGCWFFYCGQGDKGTLVGERGNEIVLLFEIFYFRTEKTLLLFSKIFVLLI